MQSVANKPFRQFVVLLNVVMLSIVMLSVVAPNYHSQISCFLSKGEELHTKGRLLALP